MEKYFFIIRSHNAHQQFNFCLQWSLMLLLVINSASIYLLNFMVAKGVVTRVFYWEFAWKINENLKKRWVALPLLTFNLKMIILPKLLIERIERRKLIRSLISRHSSALLFLCWVNNSTILISSSVRLTHSSQLINIHGG